MTDINTFNVPLQASAVEAVCNACENGFYRPDGGPALLLETGKQKIERFPHKCTKCGDERMFDIVFPQIRHDSYPKLNWTDKSVRQAWTDQEKSNS